MASQLREKLWKKKLLRKIQSKDSLQIRSKSLVLSVITPLHPFLVLVNYVQSFKKPGQVAIYERTKVLLFF